MNDGRRTPPEVFGPLHQGFPFTLDPCPTRDNPLGLPSFFTEEDNGSRPSWAGHRVFCNPPYSHGSIIRWVEKAASEREALTAILIPARTPQPSTGEPLRPPPVVAGTFLGASVS